MPPAGASRCCPVPDLRTKDPLLKQRNGSLSSPARAGTPTVRLSDLPTIRPDRNSPIDQETLRRFGIYLGGGRPSRSQVFTLELFPGGRQTGHYSTQARFRGVIP